MTTDTHNQSKSSDPKQLPAKPLAKTTKQKQLAAILNRKSGASIAQLQSVFGWQPHTARAALSRLRNTGIQIERSTTKGEPIYRIVTKV